MGEEEEDEEEVVVFVGRAWWLRFFVRVSQKETLQSKLLCPGRRRPKASEEKKKENLLGHIYWVRKKEG